MSVYSPVPELKARDESISFLAIAQHWDQCAMTSAESDIEKFNYFLQYV